MNERRARDKRKVCKDCNGSKRMTVCKECHRIVATKCGEHPDAPTMSASCPTCQEPPRPEFFTLATPMGTTSVCTDHIGMIGPDQLGENYVVNLTVGPHVVTFGNFETIEQARHAANTVTRMRFATRRTYSCDLDKLTAMVRHNYPAPEKPRIVTEL